MLERGGEDAGRAVHGGDDELLGLDSLEVEGGGGVRDRVDAFDGLVERAILCGSICYCRREDDDSGAETNLGDVIDDRNLELIAVRLEDLAEVLGLALGAHSAAHGEAMLEVGLGDPDADETVCTGDEGLA